MDTLRTLVLFRHYYKEFMSTQNKRVKRKINDVLFLITTAKLIPKKFFEHIEGTEGLFCIRVEFESNIYRVFCCFDEGRIIVLFNGFQKKTQKISSTEIDKALRIKKEYFETKL
jgi:phage-related protein